MKRVILYTNIGFLVIMLFMASCKRELISKAIVNQDLHNVSLTVDEMTKISDTTVATLDNDKLVIPVKISFSGASPQAFSVQLAGLTDTIGTLISAGKLPAGTVALDQGQFTLPPVVDVAFGVKSVSFDLVVSRTFMELNYGKEVALAVKLIDPKKGNMLSPNKSTTIVLINTGMTIAPQNVHYVSFSDAGSIINVPGTIKYSMGSQNMSIPLALVLSGEAGASFTVEAVKNTDTLNTLLSNGTLQNTVLMAAKNFTTEVGKTTFAAGKNTASVNLLVNFKELMLIKGRKVALALTLSSPSKFQISPLKKTVVVVFEQDKFRPYNGTPFTISGVIGQTSPTIFAAYYDMGGEGVAYHDNGGRDGGDFRRPDEVDIGGNAPEYVVGWTGDGEWLTYSVVVQETGDYEFNAIIGAPGTNGRYSLFMDDVNISGILASNQTPGAYGDLRPNLSMVHLTKGSHILKFFMNVGAYDFKGMAFTRKN
ncbi:hypothetical protein ACVWYG_002391 [Pedobacter sp. UYEF25]